MTLLPREDAALRCVEKFEEFTDADAIADASPVFISRPRRNQHHYYSGEYKRHCVKVQVLILPDGQCIHLSKVYRGRTHDKAIFDSSRVANVLSFRRRNSVTHYPILADLGYLGITRTCPMAILPYKRQPGRELGEAQKEHNRKLSRDRILVENCFGRWKSIFGIGHHLMCPV
jgi:hypothetical protein